MQKVKVRKIRRQDDRMYSYKRVAIAGAERRIHFGFITCGQGFTMAEILISLTIIGIIAAITLPSLRANINESAWATQRKALYSRMSQAISMMPSLNGYGVVMNANGTVNYSFTNQKAALAFVTEGLDKVLKINNICDSTNLSKCGISSKFKTMVNSNMNFPTNITELNPTFTGTYSNGYGGYYTNPQKDINTNAAAFETNNGESVAVFYNPLCHPDMGETDSHYSQPKMCANFIYDLNGKKGPNKVGKDIGFIAAIYPTDSNVVAPMPLENNAVISRQTDAQNLCNRQDKTSRLPNRYEIATLFYNKRLIGISSGNFWSASLSNSDNSKAWVQIFYLGQQLTDYRSGTNYVRCIKR